MGRRPAVGRPEPGSSRCHLLSRTRRTERRGGPGQASPGVKRPLRAPVRRADRPSKVSMGSVRPPPPAGPGTASAKNRAELPVQASPSPAELQALGFPQLPQRGATPPGQPATFPPCPAEVETPRPSKEPAAACTSALWSAAHSHRCKRIPIRHSCPASASSHPRPLR